MLEALYWLLIIEVIGLMAFPWAFALLPWISDRGYSIAKPLGLLLLSWPLWFLGSFNLVPTTVYTLWGALLVLTVISGWYGYRRRKDIAAFLHLERHSVLLGEAVFLLMYVAWVLYRSYDPSIDTTEKPMDFAFLNASIIADFFPPKDPWLRGHDIPYYYFGYLMIGNLTELTSIPSSISYNLGLAVIPALAATAVFGLVYNLIRAQDASILRAVRFAMLGPVLLLLVSNLEGVLELIRIREWASASFWEWLSIKDLGLVETSSWRQSDYLWWWRASRVIDTLDLQGHSLDYTITEFPFFSFLLGDLHPHVMSIPFILLFLTFSLNFCLSPTLIGARWVIEHSGTMFVTALILGALAFINAWDIVPFGALWVALVILKCAGQRGLGWVRVPYMACIPIVATIGLTMLMYMPYYFSVDSQASGILPVGEIGTRPIHLFIIWGLFLSVILPFLLWQLPSVLSLASRVHGASCLETRIENQDQLILFSKDAMPLAVGAGLFWPRASVILVLIFLPFFVWSAWHLGWSTLTWSAAPLEIISERFLNLLPLILLLFVALYSLIRYGESGGHPVMSFVMAILSLALFLILGPEFLRVDDLFHNRMNTIFKSYYQAWILLAIVASFGLYFLNSTKLSAQILVRVLMKGLWGLIGVLFIASVYYPVEAVFTKSGHFNGDMTLDGLAYISDSNPGEYDAIRWLQENGELGEGLLEAVGDSWSPHGRISGSTGLPTILGWPWHEHQWRGSRDPFEGREDEVATVYTTLDDSEARKILGKYDIEYVVIGPRELRKYGEQGMGKFSMMGTLVFTDDGVTIYRLFE